MNYLADFLALMRAARSFRIFPLSTGMAWAWISAQTMAGSRPVKGLKGCFFDRFALDITAINLSRNEIRININQHLLEISTKVFFYVFNTCNLCFQSFKGINLSSLIFFNLAANSFKIFFKEISIMK